MNDYASSLIRTVTPVVVGWLIALLPSLDSAATGAFVSSLLAALYYALVRVLEDRVSPKFGWLLGLAKTPGY